MSKQQEVTLAELKAELDIIELEDRLELVALSTASMEIPPGGNGVCCCS